ncbi:hypothetical protein ACGF5M_00860 [Gemmatimonadota bacterium]
MGRRSKGAKKDRRGKRGRTPSTPTLRVGITYYRRPFALLHEELARISYDPDRPHSVRKSYWELVSPGEYEPLRAQPLLRSCAKVVEDRLSEIISQHSLIYWLHLYRRISPFGLSGKDRRLATVYLTRATMEAAFQKYASLEDLGDVGVSTDLGASRILGGILQAEEFTAERTSVLKSPELVLADFSASHLADLYDAEKLSYEIWRVGAHLRSTGKGQSLWIGDSDTYFIGISDDELSPLLTSYDERVEKCSGEFSSSVGIPGSEPDADQSILLPAYNFRGRIVQEEGLRQIWKHFTGAEQVLPFPPNFLWAPFEVRKYFEHHRAFSEAFSAQNGVPLASVLSTVSALAIIQGAQWSLDEGEFYHSWTRAYTGPYRPEQLREEIEGILPFVGDLLGLSKSEVSEIEVQKGLEYWSLEHSREVGIDLGYAGPHAAVLPVDEEWVIVDFAWIARRLKDLFFGVSLDEQHYKGEVLEAAIGTEGAPLTVSPCHAPDGSSRQIDASYEAGDRLVIVEARAVGRSIGVERGQIQALEFRRRVLEKALDDIDDKARWLRDHRTGRNYDVSGFKAIIPIAVTPFVEFIPSSSSHFWLRAGLPRVLTPGELGRALADGSFQEAESNLLELD